MQQLVELSVKSDGLHITLLPGADVREEVEEIMANEDLDADSQLAEVLEWNLGNSDWTFVQPEQAGALTDAPLLSDQVETDDEGTVTRVGRLFWWPQYEVKDALETLLQEGEIIFERGDDPGTSEEVR